MPKRQCLNCDKQLATSKKYCSNLCQQSALIRERITSWLTGGWDGSTPAGTLSVTVKTYLLSKAEGKCPSCGWDKVNPVTGRTPLEVNHIDGNWNNNSPTNLEVMCPNCHSLTSNYKALNKGNGRAGRDAYDQFKVLTDEQKIERAQKRIEAVGGLSAIEKRTCGCGNAKTPRSKRCRDCFEREKESRIASTYPSLEEIKTGVQTLGWEGYSRSLGVESNALRKHLRNRKNVDPTTLLTN